MMLSIRGLYQILAYVYEIINDYNIKSVMVVPFMNLLKSTNNDNNNRKSTFWLYERKYLRLRNVEVSYDFPQTWTRKFFVSNLRLGFVGQNLLTWAPFKMWDPEGTREDGSNYPINKTFSCYLQISF